MPLKEKCTLQIEVFSKFRDRFQFPNETKARLPRKGEKACAFAHGVRPSLSFERIQGVWVL